MSFINRLNKPLLLVFFTLFVCSCGGGSATPVKVPEPEPAPPVADISSHFVDATEESGLKRVYGYKNIEFTRTNKMLQLFSGGAAVGDYDNDGDIDLFFSQTDLGPNLLYQNNGKGVFVDVAASAGVAFTKSTTENYRHSGPIWADMNGNGHLDLFIGGVLGDPSFIFKNNGDGTFTDVTAEAGVSQLNGIQNISAGFGDYDLDGDLDMYVTHWGTERVISAPGDTGSLWRNDSENKTGLIKFTSVSIEAGISPSLISTTNQPDSDADREFTFTPTFAKINDDKYPDLLVFSDFSNTQQFMNTGNKTFINETDPNINTDHNGMGSALADFDNDGDLDWFITAIYSPTLNENWDGNRLFRNNNGVFEDITESANVRDGGWGWGACFIDFENDGDLDLYHTNGWDYLNFKFDKSKAFSFDKGVFNDKAKELGLDDSKNARGVVCADFDGDTDIVQTTLDDNNAVSYYKNESKGHHYLAVKLKGLAPNTEAIGARVFASVGDVTQMREVILGGNFTSQNTTIQSFGLGNAEEIDTLRIEWPDGRESVMTAIQVDQKLIVSHPDL
ncbi:CRTAC1 family protein [Colwelliaceae bacterium 6441]